MEPIQLIAPNLNGVVYRNHIPERNIVNTFLDFIDINKDGKMLVGSSNLNGRYWDGAICCYNNYKIKSIADDIQTNIGFNTGVTDGKFLKNEDKIIVSEDSGDLNILDWSELGLCAVEKFHNSKHEERITEVSLWNNKHFVTSGADGTVRTWEITDTNLVITSDYEQAHHDLVSSVCANPNDDNLFVSCSYDRSVVLWDKREENPGKVIYENECCFLTKVEFHPSKSNIIVVSTSSGDIYLLDTREPETFLSKHSAFQRSIHKVHFSPEGLLGTCADDHAVKVFDTKSEVLKLIYVDNKHSDFARGLAWKNEYLVSCGWDKQIYIHCP